MSHKLYSASTSAVSTWRGNASLNLPRNRACRIISLLLSRNLAVATSSPNQLDQTTFKYHSKAVADVVIIGGGLIGASVAYHLSQRSRYILLMIYFNLCLFLLFIDLAILFEF